MEVDEVIFCLENSSLLVATSEVAFVILVTGIFGMPCSCVVFDKLSFSVDVVLFFVVVALPAVKAGASVVCNNPFILVILPPTVGDATFIVFSDVFTGPTVVLMEICFVILLCSAVSFVLCVINSSLELFVFSLIVLLNELAPDGKVIMFVVLFTSVSLTGLAVLVLLS